MTLKKVHLYNMAHWKMQELCQVLHRPCTAGEFAKHMGISRSTAVKWITEMMTEGEILSFVTQGKNHQPMARYEPSGRGAKWHYPLYEQEA